MARKKFIAMLFILLLTSVDPVNGEHRLAQINPICVGASAIGAFSVIFTGTLAGLEVHDELHPATTPDPAETTFNGDFHEDGFADDPHKLTPVSEDEAKCFMEMDLDPIHCQKSHLWNNLNQTEENPGACFTACLPKAKPADCPAEEWSILIDKTVKKVVVYPNLAPDKSVLNTHHGTVSSHPPCSGNVSELRGSAIDVTNATETSATGTAAGRKLRRKHKHHRTHKLADKIKNGVHKAVDGVKKAAKSVVTYTKAHATVIKKVVKWTLITVAVSVAFAAATIVTAGAIDAIMGAAAATDAAVTVGVDVGTDVAVDAAVDAAADGAADAGTDAGTDASTDAGTDTSDAASEEDDACATRIRRLCEGNAECMHRRLAGCKDDNELNDKSKDFDDFEFDNEEKPRSKSFADVTEESEDASEESEDSSEESEDSSDKDSSDSYNTGDSEPKNFQDGLDAFWKDLEAQNKVLRMKVFKHYVWVTAITVSASLTMLLPSAGRFYFCASQSSCNGITPTPTPFYNCSNAPTATPVCPTGCSTCRCPAACDVLTPDGTVGDGCECPTPTTVAPTPAPNAIQGLPCTSHYQCIVRSAGQANTHFCQKDFPTATQSTCSACASCNGSNGVTSSEVIGSCGYCGTVTPKLYQVEMSTSTASNPVFANITACFSHNSWNATNIPQANLPLRINNSFSNATVVVYRPANILERWGKYKAYAKVEVPVLGKGVFAYNTSFSVQPYDCFKVWS